MTEARPLPDRGATPGGTPHARRRIALGHAGQGMLLAGLALARAVSPVGIASSQPDPRAVAPLVLKATEPGAPGEPGWRPLTPEPALGPGSRVRTSSPGAAERRLAEGAARARLLAEAPFERVRVPAPGGPTPVERTEAVLRALAQTTSTDRTASAWLLRGRELRLQTPGGVTFGRPNPATSPAPTTVRVRFE